MVQQAPAKTARDFEFGNINHGVLQLLLTENTEDSALQLKAALLISLRRKIALNKCIELITQWGYKNPQDLTDFIGALIVKDDRFDPAMVLKEISALLLSPDFYNKRQSDIDLLVAVLKIPETIGKLQYLHQHFEPDPEIVWQKMYVGCFDSILKVLNRLSKNTVDLAEWKFTQDAIELKEITLAMAQFFNNEGHYAHTRAECARQFFDVAKVLSNKYLKSHDLDPKKIDRRSSPPAFLWIMHRLNQKFNDSLSVGESIATITR